MTQSKHSLDDLIESEIDTIMYSGAPQTVKQEAVKRRDALIKQRSAVRATLKPHPLSGRYCTRCRAFGWLTFASGDKAACSCTEPRCASAAQGMEARRAGTSGPACDSPSALGGAPQATPQATPTSPQDHPPSSNPAAVLREPGKGGRL